ncbi:MAG: LptF/LptG family permease, partial [Rhodospirillales bacterium]|nr:LptF/LptG family permease [Rhodospirillales bacterium]
MLLITAGLACIIWLIQSLRLLEMIVNRGLSAGTFLYLTVLTLPNTFPLVLPIALFAIVVFVYSKLITDRELVVMRGTGMSQIALARPALLLALIVTVVTYAINLFVIPESWRTFRELQWQLRYSHSHVMLRDGAFNPLGEAYTVYFRERSPDGQLLGILFHDNRNKEKPTTHMAERGALIESTNGPRLLLFDGSSQEMERSTG